MWSFSKHEHQVIEEGTKNKPVLLSVLEHLLAQFVVELCNSVEIVWVQGLELLENLWVERKLKELQKLFSLNIAFLLLYD